MLIDASLDLFHRLGYRNTSTTDVGVAAGVSGPAVYRHFANKEELLRAVLEVSADDLRATEKEVAGLPAEAGLERLLAGYAGMCVRRPGLPMIWLEERRNLSPEVREPIGKGHQDHMWVWTDVLVRVRPELTRAEAHVLAQLAIGLMTSVTFLHLDPHHTDQVDGDGLERLLVTLARRMLLDTPKVGLTAAVSPTRRLAEESDV
jgi:AcrR family transcriptional regulator